MKITLSQKQVVARKQYHDNCMEHLEFGLIKRVDGKWFVDLKEAKDLSISDEDIKVIQFHCDRNFQIPIGEKYKYYAGIYDGEFYVGRTSISLSAIISKYDLWYED